MTISITYAKVLCETENMADESPVDGLLRFSGTHSVDEDYRVFEFPPSISQQIEVGGRLEMKGESDGNAVFCTSSETFTIRKSETSNMYLLLPGPVGSSEAACNVVGSVSCTYVLQKSVPELSLLRSMLSKYPPVEQPLKRSKLMDGAGAHHGHTFEELCETFPSSCDELLVDLKELDAIEIAGRWMLLETVYAHQQGTV
jgi:hypothetical protein